MKDKSKIILPILTFILVLGTIFTPLLKPVSADSGFDSSYDSGSSWDWGGSSSSSDWGSSDWGSSWDHDSYYSGGSGDMSFGDFMIVLIVFAVIFGIVYIANEGISIPKPPKPLKLNRTKEMTDNKLEKVFGTKFDKKEFAKDRYKDYLDIQHAWTNFDYTALRDKLTDELYNQYEMQLETLKVKNQVNEMSGFACKEAMITAAEKVDGRYTVTVEMIVTLHDYISQDGKVVRGNKFRTITQHYQMTFVSNESKKVKYCPNCGKELTEKTSQKCEYCDTVINQVGRDWVLSKKESLRQQ